ncbi:uncharacterized protein LOC136026171 isoform X2 [Artemia franciscana]|uniref:uncharacterized protein LOC136026171 isoform X2 n=1 Tax=Artemia franciscana TaxID=6661 RepID=UPI0032DA9975
MNSKEFLQSFVSTKNPNDFLPLKVPSYYIRKCELQGQVTDWILQYIGNEDKPCSPSLLVQIARKSVEEVMHKISYPDQQDDKGIEPVHLMKTVLQSVHDVCHKLLESSNLENVLSTSSFHPYSVQAIKNTRRRMEDRHVVIQDMNGLFNLKTSVPVSYYAIFDGHGGTDAAFYAAAHLHYNLVHSPYFPDDIPQAIRQAFKETDQGFLEISLKCGTTALCALLYGNDLFVAWAGDSQAIISRSGEVQVLVNPHRPTREDEVKRVESLGGMVSHWDGVYRVNGMLSVSRAIGDKQMKPFISSDPEITRTSLDGADFLILGCDGLWDCVSFEEAVGTVVQSCKKSGTFQSSSVALVDLAKKNSSDNISVLCVFFKKLEDIQNLDVPLVTPRCSTSEDSFVTKTSGLDFSNLTTDLFEAEKAFFNDLVQNHNSARDDRDSGDILTFQNLIKNKSDSELAVLLAASSVDVDNDVLNEDQLESLLDDGAIRGSQDSSNQAEDEDSEDEWSYHKPEEEAGEMKVTTSDKRLPENDQPISEFEDQQGYIFSSGEPESSLVQLDPKAKDIIANGTEKTIAANGTEPSAGTFGDLSLDSGILPVVSASNPFPESLPVGESIIGRTEFFKDDQILKTRDNNVPDFTPDLSKSVFSGFDNKFESTDVIQETPSVVNSVSTSEFILPKPCPNVLSFTDLQKRYEEQHETNFEPITTEDSLFNAKLEAMNQSFNQHLEVVTNATLEEPVLPDQVVPQNLPLETSDLSTFKETSMESCVELSDFAELEMNLSEEDRMILVQRPTESEKDLNGEKTVETEQLKFATLKVEDFENESKLDVSEDRPNLAQQTAEFEKELTGEEITQAEPKSSNLKEDDDEFQSENKSGPFEERVELSKMELNEEKSIEGLKLLNKENEPKFVSDNVVSNVEIPADKNTSVSAKSKDRYCDDVGYPHDTYDIKATMENNRENEYKKGTDEAEIRNTEEKSEASPESVTSSSVKVGIDELHLDDSQHLANDNNSVNEVLESTEPLSDNLSVNMHSFVNTYAERDATITQIPEILPTNQPGTKDSAMNALQKDGKDPDAISGGTIPDLENFEGSKELNLGCIVSELNESIPDFVANLSEQEIQKIPEPEFKIESQILDNCDSPSNAFPNLDKEVPLSVSTHQTIFIESKDDSENNTTFSTLDNPGTQNEDKSPNITSIKMEPLVCTPDSKDNTSGNSIEVSTSPYNIGNNSEVTFSEKDGPATPSQILNDIENRTKGSESNQSFLVTESNLDSSKSLQDHLTIEDKRWRDVIANESLCEPAEDLEANDSTLPLDEVVVQSPNVDEDLIKGINALAFRGTHNEDKNPNIIPIKMEPLDCTPDSKDNTSGSSIEVSTASDNIGNNSEVIFLEKDGPATPSQILNDIENRTKGSESNQSFLVTESNLGASKSLQDRLIIEDKPWRDIIADESLCESAEDLEANDSTLPLDEVVVQSPNVDEDLIKGLNALAFRATDEVETLVTNEQPGVTETSLIQSKDVMAPIESSTPSISEHLITAASSTPQSSHTKSEESKEPAPTSAVLSSNTDAPQEAESSPIEPLMQSSPQKLESDLSKGLDEITPLVANEQPETTEVSEPRPNDLLSFENTTPALIESTATIEKSTPQSSCTKSEKQKEPAPISVESSSDIQTPQLVESGPSKPSSQSSPQKLKTGVSKGKSAGPEQVKPSRPNKLAVKETKKPSVASPTKSASSSGQSKALPNRTQVRKAPASAPIEKTKVSITTKPAKKLQPVVAPAAKKPVTTAPAKVDSGLAPKLAPGTARPLPRVALLSKPKPVLENGGVNGPAPPKKVAPTRASSSNPKAPVPKPGSSKAPVSKPGLSKSPVKPKQPITPPGSPPKRPDSTPQETK